MRVKYPAIITLIFSTAATAATHATFESSADSPFQLQTFSPHGGATVEAFDDGKYLQMTPYQDWQDNWALFDRTDLGTYAISTFSFQFRMDLAQVWAADGFSMAYLPTAIYGANSLLPHNLYQAEDPAAEGVLGIGFDTFNNQWMYDLPNVPFGAGCSEISLFYNGQLIARVDDTRLLTLPLDLRDWNWHQAMGTVNFQNGTVSLQVDGQPIFVDVVVPDLIPFESRIGFAGRTGAGMQRTSIDNINVQFMSVLPAP